MTEILEFHGPGEGMIKVRNIKFRGVQWEPENSGIIVVFFLSVIV